MKIRNAFFGKSGDSRAGRGNRWFYAKFSNSEIACQNTFRKKMVHEKPTLVFWPNLLTQVAGK